MSNTPEGYISIDEAEPKDLDPIFFREGDVLSSRVGVPETKDEFTHFGVVISTLSAPVIKNLEDGKKYILELAPLGENIGAQVRKVSDVPLAYVDGKPTVAWAPLREPLWREENFAAIRNGFKHMFKDTGHANDVKGFWANMKNKFQTVLETISVGGTEVYASPSLKDAQFSSLEFVLLYQKAGLIPSVVEDVEIGEIVRGSSRYGFDSLLASPPRFLTASRVVQSGNFLAGAPH